MDKCACSICGNEMGVYNSCHYPEPVSDSVTVRVYDVKSGYFNVKQWWTCRRCAQYIRHYIDGLSREFRKENKE